MHNVCLFVCLFACACLLACLFVCLFVCLLVCWFVGLLVCTGTNNWVSIRFHWIYSTRHYSRVSLFCAHQWLLRKWVKSSSWGHPEETVGMAQVIWYMAKKNTTRNELANSVQNFDQWSVQDSKSGPCSINYIS